MQQKQIIRRRVARAALMNALRADNVIDSHPT